MERIKTIRVLTIFGIICIFLYYSKQTSRYAENRKYSEDLDVTSQVDYVKTSDIAINGNQDLENSHIPPNEYTDVKDDLFTSQEVENKPLSYAEDVLQRTVLQKDVVKCDTLVFGTGQDEKFSNYMKQNNPENVTCSPSVFREYFQNHHRFYGDGAWFTPNERTYGAFNPKENSYINTTFYPQHCKFDENQILNGNLLTCLKRKNFKKIIMSGDSNGDFYFHALWRFFEERSDGCELDPERGIEDDSPLADWVYYSVPGRPQMHRRPGCPHCKSQTVKCQNIDHGFNINNRENLTIEFIGNNAFIDQTLTPLTENGSFPESQFFTKPVFMEFLLRDYFPYRGGYPDLWILQPPVHHEVTHQDIDGFRKNLTDFRKLLEHYLPPTTEIIFLADIRECDPLVPRHYQEEFRQISWNQGHDRNEMIHVYNQVFFDVFEDKFLDPNAPYHGFIDSGTILCPFTCVWHQDGGHMKGAVYDNFISYIFQYICNE